jgi:hypothetical protein
MPCVNPARQRSLASADCAIVPSAKSWSRQRAQIAYEVISQRPS